MSAPERGEAAPDTPRIRLRGWSAARVHATLVLGLTLSIVAFVYEVGRARQGNALSWAYVIEWPLLAGFGVFVWWSIFNGGSLRRRAPRQHEQHVAPEHEAMLAAWNEQQRELRDASEGRPGGRGEP